MVNSSDKELEWYRKRYGPMIEKRGLKNVKNLFRMPTLQEWIIFFLIIMVIIIALVYKSETQLCRETLKNIDEICKQRNGQVAFEPSGSPIPFNFKDVNIEGG